MYQSGPQMAQLNRKQIIENLPLQHFILLLLGRPVDRHLLSPNECPLTSAGFLRGENLSVMQISFKAGVSIIKSPGAGG